MKVRELIEILKSCDPELPIATYANNHTDCESRSRVVLLQHYSREFVCIGNVSKMNINGSNWYATKVLDNGDPIPVEWTEYTPRTVFDERRSPSVMEWCGPNGRDGQ